MDPVWTHPAYPAVVNLLHARTGLTLTACHQDAEARIGRAMRREGCGAVDEYLQKLERGQCRIETLLDEFVVGETFFFRDPAHFEFVRREVLPDLSRRRGPLQPYRIWSTGCSTGEEAYSLAMLLDSEAPGHPATLLATDISESALARAVAAVYSPWSLRALDRAWVVKYFHRIDSGYELARRIRDSVDFRRHNLARDQYPSVGAGIWGMDLIFCRNVMIYFDRPAVARVARQLCETLAPGGWLVTGPSDPILSPESGLEPVVTLEGVYYRRCERKPARRPRPERVEPAPERPTVPALPPSPSPEAIEDLAGVLAAGDYERVLARTEASLDDPARCALRARALASVRGREEAVRFAQEALERHPLSVELQFLHALLLVGLGRDEQARASLRRLVYLDRTLALAHFTLGTVARRLGDVEAARRSFRNARDLASARPPGEPVRLADAGTAGHLALAAGAELQRLGWIGGRRG